MREGYACLRQSPLENILNHRFARALHVDLQLKFLATKRRQSVRHTDRERRGTNDRVRVVREGARDLTADAAA